MSEIAEPSINDLWAVPGEEHLLEQRQAADRATFTATDPIQHYFYLQDRDFLQTILEGRALLVTDEDGRVTVEIFTAIYRSQRDRQPVKFPPTPADRDDFGGHLG